MLSVVFDMDGVLFDTQKIYIRTWREVASILGFENFEEPLAKCIGTNKADQIGILKECCGENFPIERFYSLKEEIFNRHITEEGVPLMRGTLDLLKTLKRLGAATAIASSSRTEVIIRNLEATGLTEYFDVTVGGDMVEHGKPSPDIYLMACEMLSVNPRDAYGVEDSHNGVRAAAAAGLKTIMVPDAQPETEETDGLVYKVFDSLNEFRDYLLLKNIMEKLWNRYPYASLLWEKKKGRRYSVSAQGMNVKEDSLLCSGGCVIRAYDGKNYTEYSFNRPDYEEADGILENIENNFRYYEDVEKSFETGGCGCMEDKEWECYSGFIIHDHPEACGDEAILRKLTEIREHGLNVKEGIKDCRVGAAYQEYEKTFISPHRDLTEHFIWMTGALSIMSEKDGIIRTYFKGYSNSGGTDVLNKMDDDIPAAADTALLLTKAEKMPPGRYECICAPDVTGMIVHEAFGHGVEMDMFVKDRALAAEYMGEYVASPLVTMHDGGMAASEAASYMFDDEGTGAGDTVIIEKGILRRGINDARTAMLLNVPATGNGRRENYEHKAYTRMTNTFFEGGTDSPEDMIASVKYGFMLENATCGMEDPKNWGIQCMVNIAREIADGRFTGRIFSPVVLSGYVPELLKSITMMSEKTELSGAGFCGKGYKEWVKVSDGGPYIKATIDLG